MNVRVDIAIIGGGIAGASLAAEVAPHANVIILEAESHAGYHSTGRSAAFWSETYGGPNIQPLTSASGPFLASPPPDFWDRPFLSSRGAIHIAEETGKAALQKLKSDFEGSAVPMEMLDREAFQAILPGLKPGWNAGLSEPTCADIDVAALHQAYLRTARRHGALLVVDAPVRHAWREGERWEIETVAGHVEADIIVNAAGAWANEVAAMCGAAPIAIQPYRRTIIQIEVDPAARPDLPLVVDAECRFYFKPEAGGRLWLSPHDETPCAPCDCAPEELDIALAIDRFEKVVAWTVKRVERSWAGLRSFAADRLPVYGFDLKAPGFFWCAGQGGFGIQTAPAASKLAAALLLGRSPDPMVSNIDPGPYLASRFAN